VTEVRNLREHEESYAQKDANEKSVSIELAKFTPKTFSEQDLAILKRILKKILGDFSFQGEIFDSICDEATIRPCSAFFLGSILLQQMSEAPENLLQVFDELKITPVQNRSSLGENLLFVHFLSEAIKLLKNNDSEICALLYTLVFYCASEHAVLANLALNSLKGRVSNSQNFKPEDPQRPNKIYSDKNHFFRPKSPNKSNGHNKNRENPPKNHKFQKKNKKNPEKPKKNQKNSPLE